MDYHNFNENHIKSKNPLPSRPRLPDEVRDVIRCKHVVNNIWIIKTIRWPAVG
jgi:hypothetical protein